MLPRPLFGWASDPLSSYSKVPSHSHKPPLDRTTRRSKTVTIKMESYDDHNTSSMRY